MSEACDKETGNQKENEQKSSIEKDDSTKTIRKEVLDIPIANMSKRGSLTSAKSLHELKREPLIDEPSGSTNKKTDSKEAKSGNDDTTTTATTTAKGIRPSKSETSIIDSFVVVENEYSKRKQNALREGIFKNLFSSDNVFI